MLHVIQMLRLDYTEFQKMSSGQRFRHLSYVAFQVACLVQRNPEISSVTDSVALLIKSSKNEHQKMNIKE